MRFARTAAVAVAVVLLAPAGARAAAAESHLVVAGTRFLRPAGTPFEWRGITAFRLVEFVAHGNERQADAYLAWAASKKLTVVRVLAMAEVLFKLAPEDGRDALPRLLELARTHGLFVEVVALADTAQTAIDIPAHVAAIGRICARHSNALLEIANEPAHPTQATALHDSSYVKALASVIPPEVPVSLGSVEAGEGYAQGSYVTWHAPRSGSDWPSRIAQGAALARLHRKPVVNDEPMGAADAAVPGRRDNVPARFRAAAVASRQAGIGATFHYEGGLQAKLPSRVELACLDAWLEGLDRKR